MRDESEESSEKKGDTSDSLDNLSPILRKRFSQSPKNKPLEFLSEKLLHKLARNWTNDEFVRRGKQLVEKIREACDVRMATTFFTKFLNAGGDIRTCFHGRRLQTNALVKFYSFLIILENLDSILKKQG